MAFSRDLRPANLDKGQEACRLRLYQLYAWGVPLVIATLAAVLDRIPPDQYMSLIRPKFGEHRCWFYGKYTQLSRDCTLLSINITIFHLAVLYQFYDYTSTRLY